MNFIGKKTPITLFNTINVFKIFNPTLFACKKISREPCHFGILLLILLKKATDYSLCVSLSQSIVKEGWFTLMASL